MFALKLGAHLPKLLEVVDTAQDVVSFLEFMRDSVTHSGAYQFCALFVHVAPREPEMVSTLDVPGHACLGRIAATLSMRSEIPVCSRLPLVMAV